ncbi:MAG TPA: hypothetical protein VMS93_12195 [Candidatus Saccharimonadales bacterium]|nr:hypothetical protein [Candidatus Saccharimonadales bacterium]
MGRTGRAALAAMVLAAVAVLGVGIPATAGAASISGNLAAHPYSYHGRAPAKFNFTGVIQVHGMRRGETMNVSFMYVFSDGGTKMGRPLIFKRDGVRQIHTGWKFGSPGDQGTGWCELKITEPYDRSICKANFSYQMR